jgi:hypothetical protein
MYRSLPIIELYLIYPPYSSSSSHTREVAESYRIYHWLLRHLLILVMNPSFTQRSQSFPPFYKLCFFVNANICYATVSKLNRIFWLLGEIGNFARINHDMINSCTSVIISTTCFIILYYSLYPSRFLNQQISRRICFYADLSS